MVLNGVSTAEIAIAVQEYEGVRRKHAIGEMVRAVRIDSPGVLASFGEDAAVIDHGDEVLLLAADGIWSRLMEADPYWAGYCAVLVNIHDIAAMGGRPLAMVDVFSISDPAIQDKVIAGMHDASLQFGVPIVGGHLHPDTPYSVIDVAILGVARKDSVIYSHTAREGDAIVVAVDLEGRVHPSCSLNWDSVTMKDAVHVRAQVSVMQGLGTDRLVSAGKDISNPGVIGTLGMLLEVSGKGGVVSLEKLPVPDLAKHNMTFEQWVRVYPGMGFVLTVPPGNVPEVCKRFGAVGLTARPVGEVTAGNTLYLSLDEQKTPVFTLDREGIMRLFSGSMPCR
ncbi:MAG: methanogenesis marker 2 protein [Methanolinea sp.]|nr:methanogenesis marker 2 protein [Methanolinea sp.]